jgi:hypothetical protein
MYDIPSLTNSTLLTADTILWCTKIASYHFLFHGKIIIPCHVPGLSHLTSFTTFTKSNLYLVSYLAAVVREPDLYRLLTFHVPLPLLMSYQSIGPSLRPLWMICNMLLFFQWVVSTSPNPQAGGTPLVVCPRLLIQYICSYPPYWRPFFHLQPVDVPCRGDRAHLNELQRLKYSPTPSGWPRNWTSPLRENILENC